MKTVQFPDYRLMELQTEIKNELNRQPTIVKGRAVKDVLLSGSTKGVEHKLGRVPEGYLITSQNANAVVWSPSSSTDRYLYLNSSASVTVDIWVF